MFLPVSCKWLRGPAYPGRGVQYNLGIVFRDNAGNDILPGIRFSSWDPAGAPMEDAVFGLVKESECSVKVILSDPAQLDRETSPSMAENGKLFVEPLSTEKDAEGCWLYLQFHSYTMMYNMQDEIAFEITCPHIFGDREVHVLSTYWREHYRMYGTVYCPECYRIELDGSDIGEIRFDGNELIANRCVIVVDRDHPEAS